MFYFILFLLPFAALFGAAPKNPIRVPPPMTQAEKNHEMGLPWFTGPLLTPSGHVVPIGHYNIEPYFFYNRHYGDYTHHGKKRTVDITNQFQLVLPIQFGIAPFIEVDVIPQLTSNNSVNGSYTNIGDTSVNLRFQVANHQKGFVPSGNVFINQSFPTGHYRKFDPAKSDLQSTGSGAFTTTIGYGATRTYYLGGVHYLAWRTNLAYSISSKVSVEGFNSYGGGYGTNGYVYPGNSFTWLFGAEYSMNTNWVLSCDVQYTNSDRNKFRGTAGTSKSGGVAVSSAPSSDFWALAPALEYNWNEHIGLIAGSWFTVAGRNAPAFTSFVAALNIYY